MRIGVVSDTHGDIYMLKKVIAAAGKVDLWLHAGDYFQDGWRLKELTGLPVTVIAGNCDRTKAVPPDEYVEIGHTLIWLTHGHNYDVKHGVEHLRMWAEEYEAGVVVYGHSHTPYNDWHEGVLIFNPGSPASPRGGSEPSFGILEIDENGRITGHIVEI